MFFLGSVLITIGFSIPGSALSWSSWAMLGVAAALAAYGLAGGSWTETVGLQPGFVHVGSPGFPFDATLSDLVAHENVPLAHFAARLLEHPTGHLTLPGPAWPLVPLVPLFAVALIGLAIAATLHRLVRRRVMNRRRRQPRSSERRTLPGPPLTT